MNNKLCKKKRLFPHEQKMKIVDREEQSSSAETNGILHGASRDGVGDIRYKITWI